MKLLPKKEIDKAKAQERKIEIDAGLALAKKVDALRVTSLTEEKRLKDWRAETLKKIQYDIDQRIEERANLDRQCDEARKLRDTLLEPLDNEWVEVNKVKSEVEKQKTDLLLDRESFKLKLQEVQKEKDKLKTIVETVKLNQHETEKAKSEAISLKELAQREYEMARDEHTTQTNLYEATISDLDQRKKEYEVAMSTIQIRENEVREKEVEIIKREQDLEKQQMILRIAKEAIK